MKDQHNEDVYVELAARYDDPEAIPSLPKILRFLVTKREARILLALPRTVDEVQKKTGEDLKVVQATLEKCFKNGMAIRTLQEDGGLKYAFVDIYVDAICGDPRNNALGLEYRELWKHWTQEQRRRRDASDSPGFFLPPRVLPIPEMAHDHNVVVPLEDARAMIEKSRRIALEQCPCRYRTGLCNYPIDDICIMLDYMADYLIDRGAGREVSKEGALAVLDQASNAGLVHMGSEHYYENSDAGAEYICNCCPCCCAFLESYFASNRKARVVTNYYAQVDPAKCVGCATGENRCHFDAIHAQDNVASVDRSKCMGCGLCAYTCEQGAITIHRKKAAEYVHHPPLERHFVMPKE